MFREREGKRGEKHQCVVAFHAPHNGDLDCNPSRFPDWELDQCPFGSQAGTQSTEPHQPGLCISLMKIYFDFLVILSWCVDYN